jgi:flavodoxin
MIMAKTLVTYYTQTGNTENIARSIYRCIHVEKDLRQISEVDCADQYKVVFLGFPIYNFEPPIQVKEFIKKHLNGKNIALFITMALTSVPVNEQITELYNLTIGNCKACARNSNILGVFDCPGELSEKTADAMIKSQDPQLRSFGMLRHFSIGYPDEKNISDAALFAENIMMKFEVSNVNEHSRF